MVEFFLYELLAIDRKYWLVSSSPNSLYDGKLV